MKSSQRLRKVSTTLSSPRARREAKGGGWRRTPHGGKGTAVKALCHGNARRGFPPPLGNRGRERGFPRKAGPLVQMCRRATTTGDGYIGHKNYGR